MEIAILIPCYNEAQTIEAVIKKYRNKVPTGKIYVLNNNSTDDTAKIALKNKAQVIEVYQQGKGNVMRKAFREIEADIYVMTDGDDTYSPDELPQMIDLVKKGEAQMVIGDRLNSTYFTQNKRKFHNFGNVLVRDLINRLFKSNVQDIMTGLRVFSRDFVKTFPVITKGFEIETEMTIHALDKNLTITEVKVDYQDRPEGSESKLNTVSDGIKVLSTIFRLLEQYKPFLFFGLISLLFFIPSVVCILIPVLEFWETHLVTKFPTLILGITFLILTFLSFTVGVILDVIYQNNRKNFEWVLISSHEQSKERKNK